MIQWKGIHDQKHEMCLKVVKVVWHILKLYEIITFRKILDV